MANGSFIKNLFIDYGTDLKKFVASKFGVEDSDDIVQDTFHNFLKKDSPQDIENPRAYLYQTAHNLALNRIRKNNHHKSYVTSECNDDEETRSPERYVSSQQDLESVQLSLQKLPEKCRKAFVLSRIHSKSYVEISEELGVSVSSVEKYLIRSMKFLNEYLEENKEERC